MYDMECTILILLYSNRYAYACATLLTYPAFQPLPEASPQRSNVLQLTTLETEVFGLGERSLIGRPMESNWSAIFPNNRPNADGSNDVITVARELRLACAALLGFMDIMGVSETPSWLQISST